MVGTANLIQQPTIRPANPAAPAALPTGEAGVASIPVTAGYIKSLCAKITSSRDVARNGFARRPLQPATAAPQVESPSVAIQTLQEPIHVQVATAVAALNSGPALALAPEVSPLAAIAFLYPELRTAVNEVRVEQRALAGGDSHAA